MPSLPKKTPRRPWQPERKPFEGRKNDNMEFYNSKRWRTLRKIFLNKHPLCAHCEQEGRTVPAVHVDHITPINRGGEGLKWENLQALCLHHHNKKSRND